MELKIGSQGSTVQQLQTMLNNLGFNVGTADGIFGQKTYEGVRQFQISKGISATGIVNDATIEKMKTAMGVTTQSSNPTTGGNMLTTYIDKIKSNKIYLAGAIAGIAGISFLVYKKVKK